MPARACASGDLRVRSTPSNRMRPAVGSVSPARQLKNVDLPAPLGPIRPTISPASTERSAPATARKLPNAFETFFASSSTAPPPAFRRDAVPQFETAARFEARNEHDNAAVYNVGEPRPASAEPGIRGRLQRDKDERADQRAEQPAGPAERG